MSGELIYPLAETTIALRQAPSTMTVQEFLELNDLTPITSSEAEFILNTIEEHRQTIQELVEYGSTP